MCSLCCAAAVSLFVTISPALAQTASPSPILVLDEGVKKVDLAPYIQVLPETDQHITAEMVLKPSSTPAFQPFSELSQGSGIRSTETWMRLHLASAADVTESWVLVVEKPTLPFVDYYLYSDDGTVLSEIKTGAFRPFSTRAIPHNDFAFEISLPPGEQRTILLHVVHYTPNGARFTLYSPNEFTGWSTTRMMVWGAIYGILLIMAGYHLLVFSMLRDRSYLFLAIYSLSVVLTYLAVDGSGHRYLWSENGPILRWFMPLSIGLSNIFLLFLAASLLDTRSRVPRIHQLVVALAAGSALSLLLIPILTLGVVVTVQLVLLVPILLTTLLSAFLVWRSGYSPAGFFLLAQAIPLAIGIVTIVPPLLGSSLPRLVRELSAPGNIMMILFTSFGLTARITLLRHEKRQAQQDLAMARELYQRIVEDQPAVICRFRNDGLITFANSAFAELVGRSLPEVIGNNVFDLTMPEQREARRLALAAIRPESPLLMQNRHVRHADGRNLWMQWTTRGLFNDRGNIEEYQALGLDVTELKQAELELSEYRNHLENLVAARTEALSQANEELKRRAEELAALYTITESLTSTTDIHATLEQVAEVVRRLFHATMVSIRFFRSQQDESRVVRSINGPALAKPLLSAEQEMVIQDVIFGRLLERREPFIIPDPAIDMVDENTGCTPLANTAIKSILCVPMLARGEILGSLFVATDQPGRQFTESELGLAETIAGPLAAALDTSALLRQEQRQRAMAESLQQVAQALNSSLELDVVLHEVLQQLARVTRYDSAEVYLQETDALVVASSTLDSGYPEPERLQLDGDSMAARVYTERRPLVLAQFPAGEIDRDTHAVPTESWMGAPLMVGSEAIGVLSVTAARADAYRAEDMQHLEAFADQAAIAVLNARLFQQTQSVAASRERERLARELHDAVTQTLFSASILAETLPVQSQSDPEGAQMTVEKLRLLTRGALAEMRTLLLELRPSVLTEVGLDTLLRQLGEAMTGSTLTPVFIESEVDDLRLPAEVQLAFYRIAQEALNNIVKHADATSVELELRANEGVVNLVIRDDGKGFDADAFAAGHLGLSIMKERAQAVGGSLTIESELGSGTQLVLSWRQPMNEKMVA